MAVEIGLITPPIAIVFTVKAATPEADVWTIFRGVTPFVLAMRALLTLVLAVPGIANRLPSLMRG